MTEQYGFKQISIGQGWTVMAAGDSTEINALRNLYGNHIPGATSIDKTNVYPAHVRTRKSFGDMTRKLSDTSSHKSPQFLGTSSFRNPSMASQNSLKVA